MARFSAHWTTAAVGVAGATTCRPCASLMGAAAGGGKLVEIEIANTTVTACQFRICRITTAGTIGADMVETLHDLDSNAAQLTPRDSHTATDCTVVANGIHGAILGAAVGAAAILTFGGQDSGVEIAKSTASGVGIVPVGTGQIVAVTFVWDE